VILLNGAALKHDHKARASGNQSVFHEIAATLPKSFLLRELLSSTFTMALTDAWDILKLAAKHYEDSIAHVDPVGQSSLTYGQLLQQSTKLAAWLQGQGIGRGDRVAVMLHNSIEVVQIHFAAAALHAIIVNVNTHWVDREINLVLHDSLPRVVLLHPQYLETVKAAVQEATNQSGAVQAPSACSVDTIVLVGSSLSDTTISAEQHQLQVACFSYASIMAQSSELQPPSDLSDSDGYQMYYTSGTTGRPKGVVLSHKIVVTHALGTIQGKSPCANNSSSSTAC